MAPIDGLPVCPECGRSYRPVSDEPPETCGHLRCSARHSWGPDEWAGRARMARARRAADVPLDLFDIEALERTEGTT